jgi:hypothetical protein
MSEPLLDLLRRRWQLSPAAEPIVAKLMLAWTQGHTALRLEPSEQKLLQGSPAVSDGSVPRPLILLPNGLLQSWRLHQAEQRISSTLHALSQVAPQPLTKPVQKALADLFPDAADAQGAAARLGLTRRFALITGGPGTGKTYTAARLLALLALKTPAAASSWPPLPAKPPSAWAKASKTPPSSSPSPSPPPYPSSNPPASVPPPCTACSTGAPTKTAAATTVSAPCRTTWSWWTKPPC